MMQINKGFLNLPNKVSSKPKTKENLFFGRWKRLCEVYLPVESENTIWRFSRETKPQEPSQGWKLHISATILEACDLFEKVAPFLISQDILFKAAKSLNELSRLNCGLHYGYWQVGKFITVYPSSTTQAVEIAEKLHELTREFIPVSVPFDEQYLPQSSVFYRYGAFASMEITNEKGLTLPAVKNLAGELVYDDRFQAVPEWISDPFKVNEKPVENILADNETLLMTTYKVFRAITQRGKGGTYQALDVSTNPPRFCIVKEGRRHGEAGWNGQDGYFLVKNEFAVLKTLHKSYADVPQIYSSFEIDGNFYLVMEYVEGKSLKDLMKTRRRRFSVKQVLKLAIEITNILAKIHQAGWIWNDCKPANLIVTRAKTLRPIDFEGAYLANQTAVFDWKTGAFSKSENIESSPHSDELYSLGAVVYFLLTGKFYDSNSPTAIKKLRRDVPVRLEQIVKNLLSDSTFENQLSADEIRREFEETLRLQSL